MNTITHFGFGSGDVVPQVGFNARRNDNNGWEGEHSFKVLRSHWNSQLNRGSFNKGTPINALDDTLNAFSFLQINELVITNEECEWVDVKTILTGSSSATYGEDSAANEPTYTLNGQLQEAPLSEHPKWKAIASDDMKYVLGKLMSGEAAVTLDYTEAGAPDPERGTWELLKNSGGARITLSGDAIEFAKLINSGQTTYLRPSFTWTEQAEGLDPIPASQLNALGNIATPKGEPPAINGSRNWMLTSATQDEAAGTFRNTLEWTLSERAGFSTFLYEL